MYKHLATPLSVVVGASRICHQQRRHLLEEGQQSKDLLRGSWHHEIQLHRRRDAHYGSKQVRQEEETVSHPSTLDYPSLFQQSEERARKSEKQIQRLEVLLSKVLQIAASLTLSDGDRHPTVGGHHKSGEEQVVIERWTSQLLQSRPP